MYSFFISKYTSPLKICTIFRNGMIGILGEGKIFSIPSIIS